MIKEPKDLVKNKKELLNYIYHVINTGSEYADGECTKEYTNCIADLNNIANDEKTLSIIHNYVHPYNSFKTISFNVKYSFVGTTHINIFFFSSVYPPFTSKTVTFPSYSFSASIALEA